MSLDLDALEQGFQINGVVAGERIIQVSVLRDLLALARHPVLAAETADDLDAAARVIAKELGLDWSLLREDMADWHAHYEAGGPYTENLPWKPALRNAAKAVLALARHPVLPATDPVYKDHGLVNWGDDSPMLPADLAELVDRLLRLCGVPEADITSEVADITSEVAVAIEALVRDREREKRRARPPVLPADLAELIEQLKLNADCDTHDNNCYLRCKAAAVIEVLVRDRDACSLAANAWKAERDIEKLRAETAERDRDAANERASEWCQGTDEFLKRAETAEREAAALRRVLEMIRAEATEARGLAFHLTAEQWAQVHAALSAPTGGTSDG